MLPNELKPIQVCDKFDTVRDHFLQIATQPQLRIRIGMRPCFQTVAQPQLQIRIGMRSLLKAVLQVVTLPSFQSRINVRRFRVVLK